MVITIGDDPAYDDEELRKFKECIGARLVTGGEEALLVTQNGATTLDAASVDMMGFFCCDSEGPAAGRDDTGF